MSERETKRPSLRVVEPGETKVEPAPPPTPPVPQHEGPSKAATEFTAKVEAVDASVPLKAAYLVSAACYIADAAIGFYHQAVAHAPASTFRHDIPPGLRAAEATRAWLGAHLAALKVMAQGVVKPYDKGNDLKQASAMAATELDRASATAKSVGLWFEEREANLFRDAMEDVALGENFVKNTVVKQEEEPNIYIFGLDVLGGLV